MKGNSIKLPIKLPTKTHLSLSLEHLLFVILLWSAGVRTEGAGFGTPWVPRVLTNYVDMVTAANPANANGAVYLLGGTNVADGFGGWFWLVPMGRSATNKPDLLLRDRMDPRYGWERVSWGGTNAGFTINPTDFRIPYRSNETTMADSPWLVTGTNGVAMVSSQVTNEVKILGGQLFEQVWAGDQQVYYGRQDADQLALSWFTSGNSDFSVGLTAEGGTLVMNIGGTTAFSFNPSTVDGTTPYAWNTTALHTTGNLFEFYNAGNLRFGVAGVTGWTGSGTNYFGDDGAFHALPSGGGGSSLTNSNSSIRLDYSSFRSFNYTNISASSNTVYTIPSGYKAVVRGELYSAGTSSFRLLTKTNATYYFLYTNTITSSTVSQLVPSLSSLYVFDAGETICYEVGGSNMTMRLTACLFPDTYPLRSAKVVSLTNAIATTLLTVPSGKYWLGALAIGLESTPPQLSLQILAVNTGTSSGTVAVSLNNFLTISSGNACNAGFKTSLGTCGSPLLAGDTVSLTPNFTEPSVLVFTTYYEDTL